MKTFSLATHLENVMGPDDVKSVTNYIKFVFLQTLGASEDMIIHVALRREIMEDMVRVCNLLNDEALNDGLPVE